MKQPNFFIVGAPKCGTTAMYTYLAQHPRIFMPELKEPHYYATDYPNLRVVKSESDYLALFSSATESHLAVGEASVHYIHSEEAIYNLYRAYPNAKIIAMLRNPIEMAQSFHAMSFSTFNENVGDFERAWRLQDARRDGRSLPPGYPEPQLLQYKRLGSLGHQVKRLYEIYPADQIHLVVFDDFKANPVQCYQDILLFLDVPFDHRTTFERVNVNAAYTNQWLGRFIEHPPALLITVKNMIGLGEIGIKERLRSRFRRPVQRPPISADFHAELVESFREEIDLLAGILNRDLSHWLD